MKQDINDILKSVRKIPGMYLAEFSIYELASFVCGYECAMHSNFEQAGDEVSFMKWVEYKYHISNSAWHSNFEQAGDEVSFMKWVEYKYHISNSAWHWSRILHHEAGSEQKAMFLFFEIWPDYWQEKSTFIPLSNSVSFEPPNKSVTDFHFEEKMNKPWLRLI